MLTCKKAARLMSEGLDRPLGVGERLRLRLHLVFCRGCRAFRAQIGLRKRRFEFCHSRFERFIGWLTGMGHAGAPRKPIASCDWTETRAGVYPSPTHGE